MLHIIEFHFSCILTIIYDIIMVWGINSTALLKK
jgi:hypothetical protein